MSQSTIKAFNTAGPCIPADHYMSPVLSRQTGVNEMFEGKYYFVLHAPRQSGKTTFLYALTDEINSQGQMYALCCSLEACQGVTDDEKAMTRIAVEINTALQLSSNDNLVSLALPDDRLPKLAPSMKIFKSLNRLCVNLDKDLVVFFDEADSLIDAPLITFLRQIRLGYNNRSRSPQSKFPRSMALVGMRDIRDYLVQARDGQISSGLASPFNIKKEAFTLPNFTQDEIAHLYHQHTEASGQAFEALAVERAWYWSEGQPWLVNALAYESVVNILGKNYSQPITSDIMNDAAENLIKRRDTHIDSLLERLKEPRVRAVMEPIIIGSRRVPIKVPLDDKRYVMDLGLLKGDYGNLRPANPIYNEVFI
ncbi:MAG: AAA-like domain-containing protein, partial [Deltaproteobacteria bacterium]|nr:AAA-like domain-containing protein [Deltaproteobacteria bacterium]